MLELHRSAAVGLVVPLLLVLVTCSAPEPSPPPEKLSAEHVAEALGGAPHGRPRAGPVSLVPDEFLAGSEPWVGDLEGILERRLLRVLVTYNSTDFFVDRGRQGGITYEMFRLVEKELNRRFAAGSLVVDVHFMPANRDRLIPALLEGQGDIVAANLTITEKRQRLVDFTAPVVRGIHEVVVSGPGAPPVTSLDDLAGQSVYVRLSSSYAESLEALNRDFETRGLEPVTVVPVDERLEGEDVLDMVNAGVFPLSVVDDYSAILWARVLHDLRVHRDVPLGPGRDLAWAIRPDSPGLKGFLDDFLRTHRAGTLTGNVILNRYLRDARGITNPARGEEIERFRSMVGLFAEYGEQYDLNWLLLVAQAYQESGLDQSRRSHRGAVGVMQLLPSTASDRHVNIPDIDRLENNIHAGARYLRFILDRYFDDEEIDEYDRHLFAFAAYNAGPARVAALRREAARVGLDPNRWMDNVEVVAAREIGRETVEYVGNIVKYYFAYRLVAERSLDQDAARMAAEG